ncbi:MAG TPA: hypothetical protein PKL31_07520 [Fulvivirga sp.]|nr:hypothetical protein [Fulvivirga sp.]
MKKIFLTILLTSAVMLTGYSQAYKTALGVRVGNSNGFTIKHFIGGQNALEGIISSRWRGVNLTGLYEHQFPMGNITNFYWFVGGGGHIGTWDGDKNPWFEDNNTHTVVGVDGIIGLEYTLEDVPLGFSADWKPSVNLVDDTGFWGDEIGISVRYTIK